jgi:antitoxin component YwqK of YwqJK toxin-antitoxin module
METIAAGMSLTVPYKDQGYKDGQGKQGKWLSYGDNRPLSVITYVNNRKTGPFVFFDYEGRPQVTGTYKNGKAVGKYTELTDDKVPIVDEEGYYDSQGNKIGVWKYKTNSGNVSYRLYDFDNHEQFSGTTKNDELVVISDAFTPNAGFFGQVVYFYPSGSIKSQGRKTSTGLMSGKWTFYKPNGEIRAEGMMRSGHPAGIWNIRIPGLAWDGNKNVLFQTEYEDKGFIKKAKVYNSKGEYIGKVKNTDFIIDYVQKILDSQ